MSTHLTASYPDLRTLKQAYMPFVTHGAVFVPTNEKLELRAPVTLEFNLPEVTETLKITGKVILHNPSNRGFSKPGVGVQFDKDHAEAARNQIEDIIAGV